MRSKRASHFEWTQESDSMRPREKSSGKLFARAPVPPAFQEMGSLAFSKLLLEQANVAVAPGVGFGEYGENYVRIALVENRQRLRQATRNIKQFMNRRSNDLGRAADRVVAAAPGE
jgi:alanine-synthesizing transaminase